MNTKTTRTNNNNHLYTRVPLYESVQKYIGGRGAQVQLFALFTFLLRRCMRIIIMRKVTFYGFMPG